MKKIVLSAVLAGLLASPAWAQRLETDKTEMEDAFRQADMIADNHIDAGEFDIYNLNVFTALDDDNDKILMQDECYNGCFPTDIEETDPGKNTVAHYRFEALDGNHNGQVAEAEYVSYARKQFRDYDHNGDKFLDKEEFFAFYQGMDERMYMVKDANTEEQPKGDVK